MATNTSNSTGTIPARGQSRSYVYVVKKWPCIIIRLVKYYCGTILHMPGCDRPALKLLNKHVVKQISSEWYDLGLELLEQEDEATLNQISDKSNDVKKCCREMFQLWLKKYSTATWDQLIQALREVDLNSLATKVEGMLRDTASATSGGSYCTSRHL